MHKKLADISLKTGESMGICLVQTPDEAYRDQILSFLGHKEGMWRWHLELSFEGKLDELETRFYLGTINDRIIGNVSTWEHDSLGVLGHVFTAKDQRRKGVFKALLALCIQDFQRRGGKTMILGTPADAPWNRIYKSVGFGSIVSTRKLQKDEVMRYDVDPDFERKYFQPGQVHTREPKWGDWPAISMLYSVQGGWFVRSIKHGIFGAFDYEDGFLDDMKKILQRKCQARVLLTEAESIVGHATLSPDNRWDCQVWVLDFFLHPLFESHAVSLLGTMCWPKEKVQCYVEADSHQKISALSTQEFYKKTVLSKQIMHKGKAVDILVMERSL